MDQELTLEWTSYKLKLNLSKTELFLELGAEVQPVLGGVAFPWKLHSLDNASNLDVQVAAMILSNLPWHFTWGSETWPQFYMP